MSETLRNLMESPYKNINREERQACAYLYSLLQNRNYLAAFLKAVAKGLHDGNNEKVLHKNRVLDSGYDELEVYFEYAKLRDVWDSLGKLYKQERNSAESNRQKRAFILNYLSGDLNQNYEKLISGLADKSISDFNQEFSSKVKTNKVVASPARWNHARYAKQEQFQGIIEKIELLNWSFNAKPDLVIEFIKDKKVAHYLCFEAKVFSGESQYEGKRGKVSQIRVQKNIFRLLGADEVGSTHIFLALDKDKGKENEADGFISWQGVFSDSMLKNVQYHPPEEYLAFIRNEGKLSTA